jgi:hypothetical protein
MAQDTGTTPTGDPLIEQSEKAEIDARTAARAANLFDVRRMIGGLFVIYGAILTVLGLGASDASIEKSAGINVNLWVGLSLLVVAALFLAWAFARPLSQELDEEGPEDDRTVKGAHAPTGPDAAAFAGSKTSSRRSGRDRDRV